MFGGILDQCAGISRNAPGSRAAATGLPSPSKTLPFPLQKTTHHRPCILVIFAWTPSSLAGSPHANPVSANLGAELRSCTSRSEPWRRLSREHCWHRASRRRALLKLAQR
ncbi:hypothetical protein ZWY2020_033706 [Hordeum vulgare]|nr:hypothetical protein ZWY2020_033706 [Hordeum vulgare]